MLLSKRAKWIAFGILVGVIFVSFSVYRYYIVNKPYQTYSVTEINVQQNEPINIDNAIYTYGTPTITEQDEQIYYEIPLTIKNERSEIVNLDYENFKLYSRSNLVQNGVGLNEVLDHPDNQESSSATNGVQPDMEGTGTLVFRMMREWGVEMDSEMDLYYVYIRGDKVEKYRVPLNY